MMGLGSLAHLFMNAAGASKFAAPGGAPNFGDALQGIGHSMKMHYMGTPELIGTVQGATNPTGLAPVPVKPPSQLDILAKLLFPQQAQPAQQTQTPMPVAPPPISSDLPGLSRAFQITPWTNGR